MKNILKHYFIGFLVMLMVCLLVMLKAELDFFDYLSLVLSASIVIFSIFIFTDICVYLLIYRKRLTYEQFILRIISVEESKVK